VTVDIGPPGSDRGSTMTDKVESQDPGVGRQRGGDGHPVDMGSAQTVHAHQRRSVLRPVELDEVDRTFNVDEERLGDRDGGDTGGDHRATIPAVASS
jgi:hypothetical protein